MFRRLFTLLAGASLMACVAAVVFWMRSERTEDYVTAGVNAADTLWVDSRRGRVTFYVAGNLLHVRGEWVFNSIPFSAVTAFRPSMGVPVNTMFGEPLLPSVVRVPGFSLFNVTGGLWLPGGNSFPPPLRRIWAVNVHWAWVVSLTAVLPVWWSGRVLPWFLARRRPGDCKKCGYDLTGNTSGVCPECGRAVEGKVGAGV